MASQSAWLQGSRSQPVRCVCVCVCVCFRCVWHCLPLIAEENTPWGKTLPLSSLWTEIQPRDRNLLSKEPSCRWCLNLYVHKGSSTQKISEYFGGNKIFFQRISIELLSLGSSRQKYWSGCHFLLQGIFQPRDRSWVSCIAGRFFTNWAVREAQVTEDTSLGPQNRAFPTHLQVEQEGKSEYLIKSWWFNESTQAVSFWWKICINVEGRMVTWICYQTFSFNLLITYITGSCWRAQCSVWAYRCFTNVSLLQSVHT